MDAETRALQQFWSRLACMLEEGRPLLPALRTAGSECGSPEVSSAVTALAQRVTSGVPLSDALATEPAYFGRGAICIIRGGEHLGLLARAVRFVADASAECPACTAWSGVRGESDMTEGKHS